MRKTVTTTCALLVGLGLFLASARAGPWAEVGDAELRSDIEILSAAGVVDNITMQWPLPWASIMDRLGGGDLGNQPEYVRQAAERVRERGRSEARPYRPHATVTIDATNKADVVRGFAGLGREDVQASAGYEYLWKTTALLLKLGAKTTDHADRQVFIPDGSYIAQRLDAVVVYAGYKTHWWGPGWFSSLILSNNARPMPQIGIARAGTAPFKSSWLSWLGPWQMEFFVGLLDGPRVARNTIYDGFRFAFSPLPHLEIGLARTDEMCGSGHPCKPLKGYLNLFNQNNAVNIVNDEGSIDVRYSGAFRHFAYEIYAQAMNEDTSPFVHSGTSHLFGGSLWMPLRRGMARLTVEYADSFATRDLWGGSIFYGFAYNNYSYVDGMRYRDRTLGFSLDSDSRLFSAQINYTDDRSNSYTLTYHHAEISDASLTAAGTWRNVVTTAPVKFNLAEARVSIPFKLGEGHLRIDVEARLQDDQPRPARGVLATAEVALKFSI